MLSCLVKRMSGQRLETGQTEKVHDNKPLRIVSIKAEDKVKQRKSTKETLNVMDPDFSKIDEKMDHNSNDCLMAYSQLLN